MAEFKQTSKALHPIFLLKHYMPMYNNSCGRNVTSVQNGVGGLIALSVLLQDLSKFKVFMW